MPRNRRHNARSERNGKERQRRSHNEAAGRRSRDLDSGVDDRSADERLLVEQTSSRAPDLEHAVEAGDRSTSREVLPTVKGQTKRLALRVEDPDSSDDSSDADTDSSTTSSASSVTSTPRPYDGTADQDVFDSWVVRVKAWAALNRISDRNLVHWSPELVSGYARGCLELRVFPSLHSRKWKFKEVVEILQKHCFPIYHKLRLQRQLTSTFQGDLRVVEYAGKIYQLARHLPHIRKRWLTSIFYAGLNDRIVVKLALDGIELGKVDLETLVKRATEYDNAFRRAEALSEDGSW
jgi:hypothetical protein